MNENTNLCEILKGHEGKIFYCPFFNNVVLRYINENSIGFASIISPTEVFSVNEKGFLKFNEYQTNLECVIFPSKDQRDWLKWDKENNHKTPKTWCELVNAETQYDYELGKNGEYCVDGEDFAKGEYSHIVTSIEKSACALLKIHQLIEAGYGGNVSNEEWQNHSTLVYTISYDFTFMVKSICRHKRLIAFHTKEQAEEFLSYPENVQLLRDYFMI